MKRYECRVAYIVLHGGSPMPQANPVQEAQETISPISWQRFMNDCGRQASRKNRARAEESFAKRYKNKTVRWSGKIDAVRPEDDGTNVIDVIMSPSDGLFYDFELIVPPGMPVNLLFKGQTIGFVARIGKLGDFLESTKLFLVRWE